MTESQLQAEKQSSPYSIRPGSVIDDESVATQLWRDGGLGSPRGIAADHARYSWFYRDNPQGTPQVYLALYGAEAQPIGFVGIGARRFYLQGALVSAGTLVDFVVSPKHRSLYPAMLLQRQGRAQALASSMQLLYGLPDTKAVAICKRLENQVTFDLPRYVRVVRTSVYFERLAPRWVVAPLALFADTMDRAARWLQLLPTRQVGEWVDEFDARFDQLWQRFDKSTLCIGERSSEFLAWRFNRQPNHSYRAFIVRNRASNEIVTYFICEVTAGGMCVKDCLSTGTEAEFKAGLLLLSHAVRRLGLNSVEIQVAATELIKRALKRAQFVVRSTRPFFAMVNEPFRAAAAQAHWYITPADEDV